MNIDNGELVNLEDYPELTKQMAESFANNFLSVEDKDITKLQKINKKVSLKDHRSVLGKQLTKARMRRNMNTQNIRRKKI